MIDIVLALLSWVASFGALCLTPFVTVLLAVGWSKLLTENTQLFNRLNSPYRESALAICLYSPLILITVVFIKETVSELHAIEATLGGLCVVNFLPLWWILALVGLFTIGIQGDNTIRRRLSQILVLIAGIIYLINLIPLLLNLPRPLSFESAFSPEFLMFLNFYMAAAFFVAIALPIKLRTRRIIVGLIIFAIVATFVFSTLASLYPVPTD